ncbi:plus-3-domain-containing protein [Melanomma pulvis-pyrius CBS 109.77]|uniref:Plus-3-domain-containing protein n=1 Tax=Melanomma pulvis-pyrius CBS 109.77 TaxID=1314802 RepID=A0A6A6XKI7_9PLEO|nr:plus-3-domain-containing protein [Melanomma pulvis-pyrius CBS 109.77]
MSADDIDDELFALAGGDDDADVEEGEASSVAASSPNSLGSGDMDESDSDRDDGDVPERDTDVPYPLEGKYKDSRDKSKISAMPQLERERILGERAEEMSKAHFQAELARRARDMEKATIQGNRKRKASLLDPDDSPHNSRQKPKVKLNDNLEAYKRNREQRGQQRQRQDDRLNSRRRRSSSGDRGADSDADADGESEVDWDERAKKTSHEEQPANLSHFESIRVGRGFFSQVCFYPGFEDAMTGTFARIGTGIDAQRRTLYKMAQIKGFSVGKPYVFEGKNGQRHATEQYVVVQHGSVRKEYQYQYLSNGRFSETDFEIYRQSLAETNAKLPTQTYLRKKSEDIKNLENRFWTDADINARIAKSEKFAYLLRAKAGETPAPRIASQSELGSQRIAEINRQNRKEESERIRQALIDAKKAERHEQRRREREMQRKKAEEDLKRKAEEEKVKKQRHLDVDALFEGDSSRAGTPKPQEKKKTERKGLPTFRKPKMEDDIIAMMDIGVDIEI